MKSFFRKNGLTICMLLLFFLTLSGQIYFGFHAYNEEALLKGTPLIISFENYLGSGHFLAALGENWESEFLQMALFVYLTACLYQKGSSESNPLPEDRTLEELERDTKELAYIQKKRRQQPILWRIYENSLSLALISLFFLSFLIHGYGSFLKINEENKIVGRDLISLPEVLEESKFWYESFQNWQSEFFSIGVIVVLSIFLRQKDSSQSKSLNESNLKTGG